MLDVMLMLVLVFLGIVLLVLIARWHMSFKKELRHVSIEIGRTDGKEREYWVRKKRRLWLSILPFVRYSK